MMTPLIAPVNPDVLAQELRPDFRVDSFRGLDVLFFTAEEAPQAMREVGRIREIAFREAGAGRNLEADLDARDFGPRAYRQLVVWDSREREIVAAYRTIRCGDHPLDGACGHLRTADLFVFADTFRSTMLPGLIELGRSVVNKRARRSALGLYATWKGLAALLCEYDDSDGFFGNFSVYRTMPLNVTAAMLTYLERYHAPDEPLLQPRTGLDFSPRESVDMPPAMSREQAYAWLEEICRAAGARLPPILISYLGAAPGMRYLGTARDPDFGDALECAILITREALDDKVRQRFLGAYTSTNPGRFAALRGMEDRYGTR